jgi:pimeloyl-ACP methyl ester carboxylesterase
VTATPAYGTEVVGVIRRCRDSLAARADLRAYTTPNAVADLEAVRAWLGYQRVSLYGVSYGTKVAQAYIRSHPERVRAAALYGVVPLSVPTQLDLARSAQATFEQVLERCAADRDCRSAFPRVALQFDSLLQRLRATPERVRLPVPDGSSQSVVITERGLRDFVQALLGSARAIERLPVLIHTASAGDFAPIARAMAGEGPPPPPGPPRGLFLSIICSEAIPLFRADQVDSATRGTFFGDAPVRSQMRLCEEWPRASLPRRFWEPVREAVPVLAISGDLDPVTPPRYGELVAAGFSRGRHLVVPNRSHNDVDPCITSLFEQFLIAGDTGALNVSCAAAPAPLRFATEPRPPPRP